MSGVGSGSSERDKTQVQVIARAAAVLRTLVAEDAGLSLSQIALRTGLARSTVQRIVAALEAERLVTAASAYGRVILGPEILRLARAARSDIVQVARPLLAELSTGLRETVDLSVVIENRILFVDQVIGPHRLRAVSAVGETFPLYCTANGKAYLASLEDRLVEELVGKQFVARTPNTFTKLPQLLADLDNIRKSGLAFDREEHTQGVCAIGVSLVDAVGHPIAISVPVPTARFADIEANIAERLLATKLSLQELIEQHGAYAEHHIDTAAQAALSRESSANTQQESESKQRKVKPNGNEAKSARGARRP